MSRLSPYYQDRWGLSWQITPGALTDVLAAGGA
jgi:predicted 3-demethylubiquinone-9 3-methyltransferase (glyoxalase superfamily)